MNVSTRYPAARRTRMRIGGILIDYVQIRPRDLTVGARVIVREGKRHVVRHVVELWDNGHNDHLGGRYRYRLAGWDRRDAMAGWRCARPQSWIRIASDG